MLKLTKTILLSATLLGTGLPAMAQDVQMTDSNDTVVENAMLISEFSTLVAAASAAGLVDTLAGEGPFTIFAPTNTAFDALPAGTVENLLLPENIEALTTLLRAHIVSETYTSDDLSRVVNSGNVDAADQVMTVEAGVITLKSMAAGDITISQTGGTFYVSGNSVNLDNASIIMADVVSSNGVIHGIDKVLSTTAN